MSAPLAPITRSTRRIAAVTFGLWSALVLAALTTLMAGHWLTLPRPAQADPALGRALNLLRAPGEEPRWLAVHVLYGECRCSQRILEHLVSRAHPAGMAETILLVGTDEAYARRAHEAGFAVEIVTRRELETRFHLTAAPLLSVVAPDGTVRYTGGYTDRKQGPDIADLAIIDEVRRSGTARERPLFGCAASRELQALLDPLGLKYSRDE